MILAARLRRNASEGGAKIDRLGVGGHAGGDQPCDGPMKQQRASRFQHFEPFRQFVPNNHIGTGATLIDQREVVSDDIAHNTIVAQPVKFSRRHVRAIVISARPFFLSLAFDIVDIVGDPNDRRVLQIFAVKNCIGAGRPDNFVGLVIVGADRRVVAQDRQVVERRRALRQLFGVAKQIIDPPRIKPERLAVGDFVTIIGVDGRLADIGLADMQPSVAIGAADAFAIEGNPSFAGRAVQGEFGHGHVRSYSLVSFAAKDIRRRQSPP